MIIFDRMPVGTTRRKTQDGYLAANAHAARVGIQNYLGGEVGRPGVGIVKVYRPEAEVFDDSSMASFANKPITLGHPAEGVSSANWKRVAVGIVGGNVVRDGERIEVPLLFTDATAIAELEGGVRELSAGYACQIDWTPGRTADGQEYDAVQRSIRVNHVALVPQGRAGDTVRVGDAASIRAQVLHDMEIETRIAARAAELRKAS